MSKPAAVLDRLAEVLAAAAPSRVVSRSFQDFARRDRADLQAGVLTVLGRGANNPQPPRAEILRVLLVGQVQLGEDTAGSALEAAEGELVDEIYHLARFIGGAYLDIANWRQSMQLEHPYGWITADLEIGPFDLDATSETELADLITYSG